MWASARFWFRSNKRRPAVLPTSQQIRARDIEYPRPFSYVEVTPKWEAALGRTITSMIAGLITLTLTLPAWAEKLQLSEISQYFNGLSTAEGGFRQFNEDGSVSTGQLYIKRPGRMRFEYDPPESAVVVAGSSTVVIYDTKSNQPAETYPLKRTPLNLILARNVNLDRAKMVVGHSFDGTHTQVTAQDPENPEYGSIQMTFTADPIALRGWTVNDANGGRTQVVLEDLSQGNALPNSLFDVSKSNPSSNR